MKTDVWKTLYGDNFDTEKYLYHYTSIDNAINIIHSDSLLFSQINKTNDTSEAKMKLIFSTDGIDNEKDYKEKTELITKYFSDSNSVVQLLCFSMDIKLKASDKKKAIERMNDKEIYYDFSGRGFALPRMWAQYASNNTGVCLVINKAKLLSIIKRKVAMVKYDPVTYNKFFDSYTISYDRMISLSEKISLVSNGSLTLLSMVQNDKEFVKYNYFEKLDDWKNEHEFRILAFIDRREDKNYRLKIDGLSSCLEGIVIGESTSKAHQKVIELLLNEKKPACSLKQIRFENRMYKLK